MKRETPVLTKEAFSEPELGVLLSPAPGGVAEDGQDSDYVCAWVAVYDGGPRGLLVELADDPAPGTAVVIALYDFSEGKWRYQRARLKNTRHYSLHEGYFVSLEPEGGHTAPAWDGAAGPPLLKQMLGDFEFLVNTSLFQAFPGQAVWTMLNCLRREQLDAGQKIIRQGDKADFLYILQEGTSVIKIEEERSSGW